MSKQAKTTWKRTGYGWRSGEVQVHTEAFPDEWLVDGRIGIKPDTSDAEALAREARARPWATSVRIVLDLRGGIID